MTSILEDAAFQQKLEAIASESGQPVDTIRAEAAKNLEEMRGKRSDFAVMMFARLSRYICRRGYHPEYFFDTEELERVRRLAASKSVVYLVTHKTYLDFFVLYDFFYRNGITPPYMFGGINMAFAGFGALARRAGGIFIRRRFANDAVYKTVLNRYIQQLISERCSFSWAIEGTRSRTGKLVLPKLGLLKYVADAARPLGDESIAYIPVSVSYDQIPDVADMAAQEAGARKKPESLGWFLSYIRGLGNHYGNVYMRFGEAVTVDHTPDAPDLSESQRLALPEVVSVQKLAFEVCYLINDVTPATGVSLVLMSLLCRNAASPEEIRADVDALETYLAKRQSACLFESPNRPVPTDIDAAIDALVTHGVVQQDPHGYYLSIVPERYLVALYYSNMAVHHFVLAAFTELGLLNFAHAETGHGIRAFQAEIRRLRDLFKFEFFFARWDAFRQQFVDELGFLNVPIEKTLSQSREDAAAILRSKPLLVAHGALSPFINAYRVVAECLLKDGDAAIIGDQTAYIARCQAESRKIGAGYPGFASKALLTNGYLLAENRGLLGDSAGVAEGRAEYANELRFISQQLDEIKSISAAQIW